MKKYIYLLIIFTVFILAGCKKKVQMTEFIPTAAPQDESTEGEATEDEATEDETQTDTEPGTEATPTPKTIHVGQTITKYVKLNEFDDILNVRSTPSTEKETIGFLVHTEKIEVIDIVDGWASFVYNGEISYVNASFLVDEKPAYLTPPPPSPTPKNTPTPKDTPTPTPDPNDGPDEI